MHIFTGTDWLTGLAEHWGPPGTTIKGYTLAHTSVANTLIDLICGGVFERYPDVRVVVVGVRDRLGGALPAAPRPRHLPHTAATRSTTSR